MRLLQQRRPRFVNQNEHIWVESIEFQQHKLKKQNKERCMKNKFVKIG